jgi:hypothetical protein
MPLKFAHLVLQLILVPSVFGGSFLDKALLHDPYKEECFECIIQQVDVLSID